MSVKVSNEPKFPALKFTRNNLKDIVGFINDKNIVILHTKAACRVFHSISSLVEQQGKKSLENIRSIYVNCNCNKGLLSEGEWEWYIKDNIKNVIELDQNSQLRKRLIKQDSIPNKVYLNQIK